MQALRDSLAQTLRVSSNQAATAVLEQVGFERLADILTAPPHRLYDPEHGGGLWGRPGLRRRRGLAARPGQRAELTGRRPWRWRASTTSCCRAAFCRPEMTGEMLEALSSPGIEHKFVKGLKERKPDARIYRKSGTWKDFHADSGIIEDENSRYIAVAVGEHPEGAEVMATPDPGHRRRGGAGQTRWLKTAAGERGP